MIKTNKLSNTAKAVSCCVALCGSVALAADHNGEYSLERFSPAQRYLQDTGAKGRLSLETTEFALKSKTTDDQTDLTANNSIIEATGHYQVSPRIFAGLLAKQLQTKIEDDDFESDNTATLVNPYVGFHIVPNIVAAYGVGFNQLEDKGDDQNEEVTEHSLSVIYHNDLSELGFLVDSSFEEEGGINYLVHGKTMITDGISLGAALSRIDEYGGGNLENSLQLTTGYRFSPALGLEGALKLGLREAADQSEVDSDFYETSVAGFYDINPHFKLGSSLTYSAEDSNTEQFETQISAYRFAVNANYRF